MAKKPAAKPAKKPAPKKAAAKAAKPAPIVSTGYWLLKSEPDAFAWDQLVARGAEGEPWTGVRNFLARNNMKAMKVGDLGFFYHSNIGKEVVGVLRVIAPAHSDPSDDTGTWECVDVEAVTPAPRPVPLTEIKTNPRLAEMALVKTSRLSVQPVTAAEWTEVCRMAGLDAKVLAPKATGRRP